MAARRRRVLVDVGGSSGEARREIQKVRDEVRRLGREQAEARIDINERVAIAKIDKVQDRIRRLKAQEPSIDVDVKLAGAYAQLDRLTLRLDRLKAKRVNIDVDVSRGTLERTASGLGKLERGMKGIAGGFANIFHQVPLVGGLLESVLGGVFTLAENIGSALGGLITRGVTTLTSSLSSLSVLAGPIGAVGGQVVSLGLSLFSLGLVAGGIVIALNAVLGAIIALSGALVALVASAAAAAAGLGALAIAFGAALIPAVIVGIGLFTRFQAILKAHQAQQQAAAQATQAAKTAEQQHTAALQARQQAERQLGEATVAARKAMAQAAIDERNAEVQLADSRLGLKGARLGVLDAKKELRDLLHQAGATGSALDHLLKQFSDVHVDPSNLQGLLGTAQAGGATGKVDPLALAHAVLNLQQAQQGVKDAVNQTANAERNLAGATRRRTDFANRGLKAYAPYRNALAAVARAEDRLARTQDATSAAQRKAQQAVKDLSATEQGTLGRVNALISGFERFAKVLTDPIFRAANSVFDSLKGHADVFKGALGQVGEAMAGVVRSIGSFLTEPRTLSAFRVMATGAAQLVTQLGARAFRSFLTIMREVAVTALPTVVKYARLLADKLAGVAGNGRGIHSVVRRLVAQFVTWAGLAWQVLRAVVGIFRGAAGPGKSLAASLTTIVKRFADWANSRAGQRRLRQFFEDMVAKASSIVSWIKNAAIWLKDHLPKAAATAKRAFEDMWPVVKKIFDAVKFVAENPIGGGANASGGGREARSDIDQPFKQAMSDKTPRQSRVDLALSLLALQISTNMRKSLTALLKRLGVTYQQALKLGYDGPKFARGGLVTGSGRGDVVPAMLEPGEFVLRRSIVQKLSLPVLHALNGGAVPQLQAAADGGGGDVHHHYHPPAAPAGNYPDGRAWIEHINRLVALKG